MAEPEPNEAMNQLESEIKNLGAAIATFRASSSLRMNAIHQMLNQLQHQQIANQRMQSHGSNSNFFQTNQQTTAITDQKFAEPERQQQTDFQQQHLQSLQPESSPTNPETTKQMPEIVDLHFQSLTLQSPEDERRTSGGGNRQIGVEVDVAVKERGKAAALLDLVTETISGGDLQSIGAVEEARLDLSEDIGDEDDASEKGEADQNDTSGEEMCGASQAATEEAMNGAEEPNGAREPRSRSSDDWHRRSLFVAKPAVLVAAVFPWDREREAPTPKNHDRSVENDDHVLMVEGVAVPTKLILEEKVSMVAGLEVAGSEARKEVDGSAILFLDFDEEAADGARMQNKLLEAVFEDVWARVCWAPKGLGSNLLGLTHFSPMKINLE